MALLLTSIRRIHKAYNRSKEFNFSLSGLTGIDLHGKTVGIIGTGKIGKVFINICRGFGMKVLAYDKFPDRSIENGDEVKYVSIDEVLTDCDIISLHCPLNDETYHLIDENAIDKCKKDIETDDVEQIRKALEDLSSSSSGIISKLYAQAASEAKNEEAAAGNDDVIIEDKDDKDNK